MKIVLYLFLIYLVLLALVFFVQRRLLYLPATTPPHERVVQAAGLTFWPARAEPHRGFLAAEQPHTPRGTVIVFHGNAGSAADRSYYVRALAPLGYRVLLAEYPGYGGRPGQPSEAALISDAKETVELARHEFGSPIYLWGESLGCGIVSALAADNDVPVRAVILVTPWDSLPNLAQTIYWFFPTRWLVLDKFDNVENLADYSGRVAVVLAGRDEVIPLKHGHRLYESVTSNKKLWVFEHAGHNSWPIGVGEVWWQEVMEFASAE